MYSFSRFTFCSFAVIAVWMAAAGSLRAAPEPQSDGSVEVDALLQRYLAAAGGEAALARISSRRSTGWIERGRTKIPFVRSQRAPNLLQTETRFPRPGTLKQGFDGTHGWVMHPLQGGRQLVGKELAMIAAGAWLNPMAHLRELFPVRRWGGARTIEGRAMLVVEFAAQVGEPFETWLFDADTALLLRIENRIDAGPQGIVPMTQFFEDYRKVDGLILPFRVRTRWPTMETILQFETVEHNVLFGPKFFSAPF